LATATSVRYVSASTTGGSGSGRSNRSPDGRLSSSLTVTRTHAPSSRRPVTARAADQAACSSGVSRTRASHVRRTGPPRTNTYPVLIVLTNGGEPWHTAESGTRPPGRG
jgi:hypothetical protein